MSPNFFFLLFASCLFCISIITINIAPIISKAHSSFFEGWGTTNCQIAETELDYMKSIGAYDEYKNIQKIEERKIDECYQRNIMYNLEYAAVIIDISLSFIIAFLALINYLEPRNNLKKTIGIFGLAIGVICAVITGVYLGYSSYIFVNHPKRDTTILYSNKASWRWNEEKYIPNYNEQDVSSDNDKQFIKIKDLGEKQYNYDSEIYQALKEPQSEVSRCMSPTRPKERVTDSNDRTCQYIWLNDIQNLNESVENKFLYDRWITTIIFSAIICVLGIGLCIFSLLLFSNDQEQIDYESNRPIPIASSQNSVSRLKNTKKEIHENSKENNEDKNN